MDAAKKPVGLKDLDKLLFAKDLVSYVITATRPSLGDRMLDDSREGLRNITLTAFCTSIKKAIDMIVSEEKEEVNKAFILIENEKELNKDCLSYYANSFFREHTVPSFLDTPFLIFCSKVAMMAGNFMHNDAVNAFEFAVDIIMAAFPNDMDWKSLIMHAESYVYFGGRYLENWRPSTDNLLYTDKLLFAVDLVNHVIKSTRPSLRDRNLDRYRYLDKYFRDLVRNGFCTNVSKAIDIIAVTEDDAVRNDFMMIVNKNRDALSAYESTFRDLHFVNGFQPRAFLKYCARVASMAGYFFSDDVIHAPDFAIEIIMDAYPKDISSTELWDELSKAAETYVTIGGGYIEERLPSGTSSDSPDENVTGSDSTLDGDYSRGANGNSSSSDELPYAMR